MSELLSQRKARAPVVIVGAGLAGLSAAAHLCERGIPILILEAQQRVGGRVHTVTLPQSPAARGTKVPESVRRIELGATWFHGTIGNAAYDLANSEGLLQPLSNVATNPAAGNDLVESDPAAEVGIGVQQGAKKHSKQNKLTADRETKNAPGSSTDDSSENEDNNINNGDERKQQGKQHDIDNNDNEEVMNIKNPLFSVPSMRMMPDGSAHETSPLEVLPHVDIFRRLAEQLERDYERRDAQQNDATGDSAEYRTNESVRDYVWARLEPCPDTIGPTARAALRAHELFERAVNGCYTTAELDAGEYGAYVTLEGDNVRAPSGMSSVVNALRNRIPHDALHLGARVTAIHWREDEDRKSDNNDVSCKVRVEKEGGDAGVLEAMAVVWTCSVNATKHACDQGVFRPALPRDKRDALGRRGQAPVEQIHVVLENPLSDIPSYSATPILWDNISDEDDDEDDDDGNGGEDACTNTSTTKFTTVNINDCGSNETSNGNTPHHRHRHHHHYHHHRRGNVNSQKKSWQHGVFALLYNESSCSVQFWLTGHAAAAFCHTPILDAHRQISQLFSTVYQQPVSVATVVRSDWANNPYIRGGYSYPLLGAQPHDITRLAEPLPPPPHDPTLFFAGEATHPRFYSTMHGAIESGVREAKRITKLWQNYC